jgi:hypothetical protein
MLPVVAGLATFIGLNVVAASVYGAACASSQHLLLLLRFSYLSWPIKVAVWFGCAWAGMSAWDALS